MNQINVTVHNMSTDEKYLYMDEDMTPQRAVMLAYIQHELDNWNTWEYPQLMKDLEPRLEYGLMTVGLGDYAAMVHMLKTEDGKAFCTCGKWSTSAEEAGEDLMNMFQGHVDRVRSELLSAHRHYHIK